MAERAYPFPDDPTRAALVILDVQAGIAASEALDGPVAGVLAESADRFSRIAATRMVVTASSPLRRRREWADMGPGTPGTALRPLTAGQVRRTRAAVIAKTGFDAVPALRERSDLLDGDVTQVWLAGACAEHGVLTTALSLCDAGLDVRVLAGLCASGGSRLDHLAAMEFLRRALGDESVL